MVLDLWHLPDGVEDVERIVELGLLWVVLDSEETCIAEIDPSNDSKDKDAVARWTLIDVQHQAWVKELCSTQAHTEYATNFNHYYHATTLHFAIPLFTATGSSILHIRDVVSVTTSRDGLKTHQCLGLVSTKNDNVSVSSRLFMSGAQDVIFNQIMQATLTK